jgi:ribosomal protein S12 methylthiotransferase accessory factor
MKVTFPGNKKVAYDTGQHVIVSDQPISNGGDGTAPDPFTFFMSSLANCAGYFAKAFMDGRELNTEGFSMDYSYTWREEEHLIDEIIFNLTLPEDFPPKYLKAVIRSMSQCTVKRHLREDIKITVLTNIKD